MESSMQLHYTAEHGLAKDTGSAMLWVKGEEKMGKGKKPRCQARL